MVKSGVRVFIAEDEPIVVNGYRAVLEKNNFCIAGEAMTGQEAYEKIISSVPDVVIMDINMPDMDGITVIEKVSKQISVPCIIITGYNDTALLERANSTLVYGYLHKPIDECELISTIAVAMRRFDEAQDLRNETQTLKQRLSDRKIIERAKGILMDDMGMKEQQAMQYLQKKSKETNIKITEIANRIIKMYE